jgi:8-oxo-dGTP pyrophosphatase MutT (NUDIX family)
METERTSALVQAAASPRARIRPRDAATLVIIDSSRGEPRMLMGRRRPEQVFLPGAYVFPGGRVERGDHRVSAADALSDQAVDLLMQSVRGTASASRAHAFALAAIRETFEETGILIGAPSSEGTRQPTGVWSQFIAHGCTPRVAGLHFFARAITPPGRPRRYDTRFFFTHASEISHRIDAHDGEFSETGWFTFAEASDLNLPSITRTVVSDLAAILRSGRVTEPPEAVPFYFHRRGSLERRLLNRDPCAA